MAKSGNRETRKEATVETQAKKDGSCYRGGRSVTVHLGIPLGVGAESAGTQIGVAGCRHLRPGSSRDSIQFLTCNLYGIGRPAGAQSQMGTSLLRELTGGQSSVVNVKLRDFSGDPVVKNPPANAGDTGLIPGPGRFHMPWDNKGHVTQLLEPTLWLGEKMLREGL